MRLRRDHGDGVDVRGPEETADERNGTKLELCTRLLTHPLPPTLSFDLHRQR